MKRIMVLLVAMVMVFGFATQSQASLTVIGEGTITSDNGGNGSGVGGTYQLIYDSGQNITWLDYSAPNTDWYSQNNWANNLAVSFNGQNLTGWSLPTTVDSVSSAGINPPSNSSQMAYLYYTDLGNTCWPNGAPNNAYGLNNVGPFKNLVFAGHWSGTAYSANPGLAWLFSFNWGIQQATNTDNYGYYGLAVLQGDPAPTPIPAAAYLLGSGLFGLVGIRKKIQK